MGVFKQVWEVYKENGCEPTLHRSVAAHLGTGRVGAASDADAAAVAAFVAEMEAFLRDADTFLLMLSVGLRGLFDTQSSFIGLLLREDVLQASLIDFLLEKLSEYATEMEGLANHAMEKNLPKLILREIRWIDHVVDSSELVEKLISALPAFPIALQRDMIYILPEIAGDEDAHKVIDAMLELIRNEAELVVCCIEALGNFNVVNEQTDDVVKCVLERLDSSPLADLPVIVKYLVQEAPGADVDLIASELREKLSATLNFSETAAEAAASNGRRSSVGSGGVDPTRNEEALVLGAIVQGFYFREDLLKAFLACVSKCGDGGGASGLCMIDIWVLVGAHSIPRDRQKVERLFKRKVNSGAIGRGLLVRSVKAHANALKSYFGSALQLASMLIAQHTSPACTQMGSLMFELLFEEFSLCRKDGRNEAAYYQGEVVTSLLGFCLSATNGTTDVAFKTLLALVSPQVTFASELRDRRYEQSHFKRRYRFNPYVPILKQLLDSMEIISSDQVRDTYNILFAVAGAEDAELFNTIRKQMSHQETNFRVCGIIGAVAQLRQQLLQHREDAATKVDEAILARDEAIAATAFNKSVTNLLRSTISQGGCVDFLLREIRHFIGDLELERFSRILVKNVSEYSMEMLSNRFMDDYDLAVERAGGYRKTVLSGTLKGDMWLSITNEENPSLQSPAYLRILDLVTSPNVRDQESLHYLSPLVELVLECARKIDDLDTVSCLLVCPIQMMEKSVIEDIAGLDDAAQNAVCGAVWHSINWIRAIINFYADDPRPSSRRNVTRRLKDLLQMESILLDDLLDSCPQFGPPGRLPSEAIRGPVGKTLEGGKKKPGRPAKNGPAVDRRALISRSFDSLRANVLKILTFRELWSCVIEPSPSSSQESDQGIRPHALVETIISVFETFALSEQQATKKGGSDSVLCRIFSRRLGWSGVEETQADKVAEVMEAICKYAHHFGKQLQASSSQDDEVEEDVDLQRSSKRIVRAYLQIGSLLFETSKGSPAYASPVKLCQSYFVPRDHHIQFTEDADGKVRSQVLEGCFVAAMKYSSAVGDDLQMATTLMGSLLAVASLAYGFPANQITSRVTKIHLKQPKTPSAASDMSSKISSMAMSFLQQDWSCGDKKFVYKTSELDLLLSCYLNQGAIVLDNIQDLAIDGILALTEGPNAIAFPTLTKKTIAVFHRAMFEALVTATVRLEFASSLSEESVELLLNYFTQAVLLFRVLVAITKSFQKSTIVSSVLKLGRKFVDIVVRAMPFFKNQFLDHTEQVMKIIAEVQIATRRMQVLCAHGKLIKDGSASAQVPMVKRLLERFIYRGEELAREHGILDAFSTGVLKNKRIDGTTISKEELEAMEAEASDSDSDHESEEEEKESESSADEDDDDGAVHEAAPSKKRK